MILKIERDDSDTESHDERDLIAIGGAIQFAAAFAMLTFIARLGMGYESNSDPFFVVSVILFAIGSLLSLAADHYARRRRREAE